jgi:hypothetical protein
MSERERFHREIFAGGDEEGMMAEARALVAAWEPIGWKFDSWWWDSAEDAAAFGAETVLVLRVKWVGEQQSQEPLRDEKTEHVQGGWNTGTRALPIHEVERERRMAEMESDLAKLRAEVGSLLAWQRSLTPVTVITGELAPVSPGPKPWEA